MGTFQYDPLDLEARSFRLLRIFGGSEEQIECEIFETGIDIDGAIPFEALSYAWGNLDTPRAIKLNGKRLAITENLDNALRHIRFEDEDRILWIDAICINQNDQKERSQQVQKMGDIYSRAEQVIFWLGHATPDINLVFTVLKRLERRSRKESCSNWITSDERWLKLWAETQPDSPELVQERQRHGLEELLQRPWFKRVWILREVANARRAVVCAGNMAVGSRIFALAPTLMDVDPDSHCQAVLDIMPGPSRRISWWSQKRDLHTLLQRFGHSRASDPRDMIYALIGIASNEPDAYNLRADYTKSTEQVINDVTAFLFGLPPCSFRTMESFLANFASLNTQAFIAIARTGNATDVSQFIEERGHQISIGTTELVAAASNKQFGEEVMEVLYLQPGITITEPVISAAIKNTECGSAILQLLTWRQDLVADSVIESAVLKTGCGHVSNDCLSNLHNLELEKWMTATAEIAQSRMGGNTDFPALDGEQPATVAANAEKM